MEERGHFFLFRMFEIKSFCFDVVMCDLLHDVRAYHGLYLLLPASGALFGVMSDARATANCSFPGITHISEKISRCCSQLRKMKYKLQIVH